MTLEEAKAMLNQCQREELRDHYFGDREITWKRGDQSVAAGYFGTYDASVSIFGGDNGFDLAGFTDDDARVLATCGCSCVIKRNDTEGPAAYLGA